MASLSTEFSAQNNVDLVVMANTPFSWEIPTLCVKDEDEQIKVEFGTPCALACKSGYRGKPYLTCEAVSGNGEECEPKLKYYDNAESCECRCARLYGSYV